jgi:hypothetical protein
VPLTAVVDAGLFDLIVRKLDSATAPHPAPAPDPVPEPTH